MKFSYRIKYKGVYYSAGEEVPVEMVRPQEQKDQATAVNEDTQQAAARRGRQPKTI